MWLILTLFFFFLFILSSTISFDIFGHRTLCTFFVRHWCIEQMKPNRFINQKFSSLKCRKLSFRSSLIFFHLLLVLYSLGNRGKHGVESFVNVSNIFSFSLIPFQTLFFHFILFFLLRLIIRQSTFVFNRIS